MWPVRLPRRVTPEKGEGEETNSIPIPPSMRLGTKLPSVPPLRSEHVLPKNGSDSKPYEIEPYPPRTGRVSER